MNELRRGITTFNCLLLPSKFKFHQLLNESSNPLQLST